MRMKKYRFKFYHSDGGISFVDDRFIFERHAFMYAYNRLAYRDDIEKIDVYDGTKLVATFYKR
jgi:hypothetical protein